MHGWCSHSNLPNDYDLSRWDINTDDNFDLLSVYSKTFPAGTISIPGNNGGNGSFLIFLERPLSTNDESQYMGCFVNDGARDLDYGPTASAGTWYTFATCQTACVGYSSMSLQYGGECFCQNTYNTASQYAQTSDSVCSMVWTTQLQSGAAHTTATLVKATSMVCATSARLLSKHMRCVVGATCGFAPRLKFRSAAEQVVGSTITQFGSLMACRCLDI